MNSKLTDAAIEERRSWQYRAIAYAKGNMSNVGAIIIAMLGRYTAGRGYHPGGFRILQDGRIVGLARGTLQEKWEHELVYKSVDELIAAFRGLAVALDLNDDEIEAMFEEVRKFIFKDDRARSYLPGVTDEEGELL